MNNAIYSTALALLIAFVGGAGSVWWTLSDPYTLGVVNAGGWSVFPQMGFPDADPYSKARVSREGILSLGRAEGLVFVAGRDSDGQALRRECSYSVEGVVPAARLWTLHAVDQSGLVRVESRRPAAIHSRQVLRANGDSIQISVSPAPVPNNWLATEGAGPMSLVLALYDTSIANGADFSAVDLPRIQRLNCNA